MSTEDLEYNIGEEEKEATVELSEDNSEAVLQQPSEDGSPEAQAEGSADELDEYSTKVQKRIDKLTARLRETQRREEAALAYAKSVQTRAQQLEERFKKSDQERVVATKGRLETEVATLKQIIRKAREEGDIDTETEAQERLTSALYDQRRLAEAEGYRQSQAAQQAAQQAQQQQQQAYAQQQQPAQARRPEPDPKAEDWAERNPWFGQDVAMTHAAQGIHMQLVRDERFDPTSDEYYDELDRRMQASFPHKYAGGNASPAPSANRPVQTVAPASRSSGVNKARRSVKLSPSQVAIAKKLGVPLEEYAKYVKE
jgi:hypothetical protein